jgi:hypothetical protein
VAASKQLPSTKKTVEAYACVVAKQRYDQLHAWADSKDTYKLGTYYGPVMQQLRKECLYVVRKVPY